MGIRVTAKVGFYLFSLISACLLIALASSVSYWKDAFLSLGSAVLGAVISLMLAEIASVDVVSHIYKRLSDHFGIQSDEELIRGYRIPMHHYHVTQIAGKLVWRYRVYDFGGPSGSGRLAATTVAHDRNNQPHRYDAVAGVRDDRFIIIDKSRIHAREPATIEIYPHLGIGCLGVFAGIGVMQTWDGPHFVTKCMISNAPLCGIDQEGDVLPPGAADLEREWKQAMSNQGDAVMLS